MKQGNDLFTTLPKERASGITAVTGYEPSLARTICSMKDSLASGSPLLIRFHSAADYPTGFEGLDKKLDMESHAVLVVGYDDRKKVFHVVDPWSCKKRADLAGCREVSYDAVCILMVNASMGKITTLSMPYHSISTSFQSGKRSLELSIGFKRPRGYVIDETETAFRRFQVELVLPGVESESIKETAVGRWRIGEYASLSFSLPATMGGVDSVHFNVEAELEGERPYRYRDRFYFEFDSFVTLDSNGVSGKSANSFKRTETSYFESDYAKSA